VGRLIPSDENGPGAVEAGAVRYIDRGLGSAFASLRDAYAAGLTALEAYCSRLTGEGFPDLDPDTQDAILRDLEQNFADGFVPDSAGFFELVRDHTLQGTFGDPHYGGNRDFIGWEMLNYPGIRLAVAVDEQNMGADNELVRLSAYDLPMFDADTEPSGGDDDAG
jgi:gluconate 2-dehydrogenase gamma chain